NYDIDLFRALIGASEDLTGVRAEGAHRASHRVIADHLRACSFLIADGVSPSNEGRGYVLRRIMRRAMRHAQLLGAKEPLMWRLVPALAREMGAAYPELIAGQAAIQETLKAEETRFRATLARGLGILEEETKGLGAGGKLPGDVAFKLYDTFGFPLDLTQDALRARGIGVDTAGFEAAMDRQRADARKAWSGSGEAATEAGWFPVRERVGATEFLGYSSEAAEGVVTAILRDGVEVEALGPGETGQIVLNQTPFYAQSGGQVGDTGTMRGEGVALDVTDVHKKLGDVFAHDVTVREGRLAKGAALELRVDAARRAAIRANHSATHLLHEALRRTLGDHVAQKGSLVAPDRLRFDFVHGKAMEPAEIAKVEEIANAVVLADAPVETRVMGIDEARNSGARALFGEKYGDEVRVVSMGADPDGRAYSVELCGGTHVRRTGEIGLLHVVSEAGSAAGIRRIEARTGAPARRRLVEDSRRLGEIAAMLRAGADDAPAKVAALMDDHRKLERELADARRRLALAGGGAAAAPAAREVAGVKLMARSLTGVGAKDLKPIVDEMKKEIGSGVVAVAGIDAEGKAGIVVGVT
ncbi:MAG: alanine--tRNA ligase, partial [Hyphomicrobiales bacterium]|nr:alanine--tRNA ligase [Hyphomicrobiales bacterium]